MQSAYTRSDSLRVVNIIFCDLEYHIPTILDCTWYSTNVKDPMQEVSTYTGDNTLGSSNLRVQLYVSQPTWLYDAAIRH